MNGYEACKKILQIYKDFNQTQIRKKNTESQCRINSLAFANSNSLELNKNQAEQMTLFIERKPIIIASSAYITEQIQDECLSIGFDFITEVPMK